MRRRQRRRHGQLWCAAAAIACAAAFGLGACSSTDDAASGHPRLTYWAASMAPSVTTDKRILGSELGKFTKRTGIRVDLEVLPFDALFTRLTSAVATGRQPDVADIGNTWSATLQASGALLPFDDSALGKVGGRARFVASAMSSTGAKGQPPASLPLAAQSYALFYNTKLFAAAGISRPPRTWTEFVRDAKLLTKPGQWGVGLVGASAAGNAHLAFILGRQHGANLFDPVGHPTFDTPGERAAVSQLLALMATQKVINPSDAEHSGVTDSLAEFAQGKAAMIPFQTVGRNYFSAVGFHDYAVAPLPLTDPLPAGGAAVRSIVAGTNVAVFKHTKHREAALQLVKFLTQPAEQVALNVAYRSLPVVTSAYQDPAFSDATTRVFGAILRDSAETMPMVAGEGKMEVVLGGAITGLWAKAATGELNSGDVAAALRAANQQMTTTHY